MDQVTKKVLKTTPQPSADDAGRIKITDAAKLDQIRQTIRAAHAQDTPHGKN